MTDQRKLDVALLWIKASSGNTYLCPADAFRGVENPAESELQRLCVDESENPQNS